MANEIRLKKTTFNKEQYSKVVNKKFEYNSRNNKIFLSIKSLTQKISE